MRCKVFPPILFSVILYVELVLNIGQFHLNCQIDVQSCLCCSQIIPSISVGSEIIFFILEFGNLYFHYFLLIFKWSSLGFMDFLYFSVLNIIGSCCYVLCFCLLWILLLFCFLRGDLRILRSSFLQQNVSICWYKFPIQHCFSPKA